MDNYLKEVLQVAYEGNEIFPYVPDNGGFYPVKWKYGEEGEKATSDLETVIKWWFQWPNAIVCRPEVGDEIGIDIDNKNGHDGNASLKKLFERFPDVEEVFANTQSRVTKSGGFHYLFVNPKKYAITQKQQLTGDWDGIDIRVAKSGMFKIPPSPGYKWLNRGPRLEIPANFAYAFIEREKATKAVLTTNKKSDTIDSVLEGNLKDGDGRNEKLYRYLCSVKWHFDISEATMYMVAKDWEAKYCAEEMPDRKIRDTVANVMKHDTVYKVTTTPRIGFYDANT